jgi:hypothetical protein
MQRLIRLKWFKLTFAPKNHFRGPMLVLLLLIYDKGKTGVKLERLYKDKKN